MGALHLTTAALSSLALWLCPQELALVIWSFATFGHRPSPEWLDSFFKATSSKSADHSTQGVSMFLWSAATLGLPVPSGWHAQLTARAQGQLHAFSAQALCNTAWALAMLQTPPPGGPGAPAPPASLVQKLELASLAKPDCFEPVARSHAPYLSRLASPPPVFPPASASVCQGLPAKDPSPGGRTDLTASAGSCVLTCVRPCVRVWRAAGAFDAVVGVPRLGAHALRHVADTGARP